jgi:hypothetical protein
MFESGMVVSSSISAADTKLDSEAERLLTGEPSAV